MVARFPILVSQGLQLLRTSCPRIFFVTLLKFEKLVKLGLRRLKEKGNGNRAVSVFSHCHTNPVAVGGVRGLYGSLHNYTAMIQHIW